MLMLTGCFGNDPHSAPDPAAPLAVADSLYQSGKYAEAMTAYEQAIAQDSTLSQAYVGYTQATLRFYGINGTAVRLELAHLISFDSLLNHSDSELTSRLQAFKRVTRVLGILADRDTLSRNFRYLDSASSADPLASPHKAAIRVYLAHSDQGAAGYRPRAQFPLTDGKVTYADIISDLAAYLLHLTVLKVYDLDGNGMFTEADRKMRILLAPGSTGDLQGLSDSMRTDTVLQAVVNQKILDLQNGLADLPGELGFLQGHDSLAGGLGQAVTFYQFGDHKDNDGDGCIDEEIVDSLDDDLDGFIDEDARLINGNGLLSGASATGPGDGVDNDRNGRLDAGDAGENKFGGTTPQRNLLTFVLLWGDAANWVQIKKDDPTMDIRFRIQMDSLAVRLVPGQRPVPAAYQAKLDSAKTLIGGCWRNY